MLRFFSKIRQRLLGDNKFSTYLLYAVSEIVLVVIGILTAWQINNWNEDRKLVTKEIQILTDIRCNLEATLANLNLNLESNQDSLEHYRSFEYNLANDIPYDKKMDKFLPCSTIGLPRIIQKQPTKL